MLPVLIRSENQNSTLDKDRSVLWILLGGSSFAINIGLWCVTQRRNKNLLIDRRNKLNEIELWWWSKKK